MTSINDRLARAIRSSKPTQGLDKKVLFAAKGGHEYVLSETLPVEPLVSNTIQASTICRALTDKRNPLHYRGLRLQGFYIAGDLDLAFAHWTGELSLVNCKLDGRLILDHAKVVGRVKLNGSHADLVSTINAVIDGAFLMRDGFTSCNGFFGLGIRVSGSLNLRNSHIIGPESKPQRMAVELFRANLGDLSFTGQNSMVESTLQA
jgi:hypothetical protein